MEAHEVQITCAGVWINPTDGVLELTDYSSTGSVTVDFNSRHDFGLVVGGHKPATFTSDFDGKPHIRANGHVHLCGITVDEDGRIIYRCIFQGHEVKEDGQTPD